MNNTHVNRSRVLLSLEHEQFAQLLINALQDNPAIEIVGQATEPIECMMLLSSEKPNLWIHGWKDGPEMRALLSHVYQFHPHLAVVRLDPEESAGYASLQINSLTDLVKLATRPTAELHSA